MTNTIAVEAGVAVRCPNCLEWMQLRHGKFGPFLFCPNQHHCGQKTISVKERPPIESPPRHPPTIPPNLPPKLPMQMPMSLHLEGMAKVAYENEREHEYTRDRASVDAWDVVFGGGMFCDMGMEDDDEDVRPW